MADFSDERWRGLLEHNGLSDFAALWNLQVEWFEPPNQGRGGWSGVARIELQGADGSKQAFFLKRQENHTRRTLLHPTGEPTFAVELRNILRLTKAGVPTVDVVYYGQRRMESGWRAILISRELDGFLPLGELTQQWWQVGWSQSMHKRRELIPVVADVVHRLHACKLVHRALYPKHIFVRFPEHGKPQVRLLDLEKMRWAIFLPQWNMRRELDSLNRRARHWSRTDRMRFLHYYRGGGRLSTEDKELWRELAENKIKFMRKHGEYG
jgi:hypothetical protein